MLLYTFVYMYGTSTLSSVFWIDPRIYFCMYAWIENTIRIIFLKWTNKQSTQFSVALFVYFKINIGVFFCPRVTQTIGEWKKLFEFEMNRNLRDLLDLCINVRIVLFAQRKLFLPDSNDLTRNTDILYDEWMCSSHFSFLWKVLTYCQ